MNTRSSKKRGGDQPNGIPLKKKMVQEKLETPFPAKYDVTIIVKGQRFQCLREELSDHSMFFQRMFNSNFQEKDKKEVELKGMVESEIFKIFLMVVHGEYVVTDVHVEKLLELADYLESATLEANCVHHLGQKTGFSLAKQFELAENYHSKKLMMQTCASIKDAYELDEVVPKDLDSFCNTTKNIVMQRSFELLGIRKPPSPPLPEHQDQIHEHMMNQIIDQVEVQNHHGEVLKDQVEILYNHTTIEAYFGIRDKTAKKIIRDDPLVKELTNQLRYAHEQNERNFVHAQLQVVTFKHIYTRAKNEELRLHPDYRAGIIRDIPVILSTLSEILNLDERSRSRSHKITLGNREIDEIYRRITDETMQRNQVERPRNTNGNAEWLESIRKRSNKMANFLRTTQHQVQRPIPSNQQNVSNRTSFRLIDEYVSNARKFFYTVTPGNEPVQNGEDRVQNQ